MQLSPWYRAYRIFRFLSGFVVASLTAVSLVVAYSFSVAVDCANLGVLPCEANWLLRLAIVALTALCFFLALLWADFVSVRFASQVAANPGGWRQLFRPNAKWLVAAYVLTHLGAGYARVFGLSDNRMAWIIGFTVAMGILFVSTFVAEEVSYRWLSWGARHGYPWDFVTRALKRARLRTK